ncbi:hypothetical protein SAY86_010983 [Trapa natans]|uniref:Uncharacterized protein n=1 Tax=Trapa natans TaxID=22666 RepID=A0AAN7LT49_TRANT|nr:hypothetical protein SAY86_010983 [Trapa natans]
MKGWLSVQYTNPILQLAKSCQFVISRQSMSTSLTEMVTEEMEMGSASRHTEPHRTDSIAENKNKGKLNLRPTDSKMRRQ